MAQEFKPGEKAPVSGIYRVVHDQTHKATHEDTMPKGHTFPPCGGCKGGGPRYVLVRETQHLR